MEIKTQTPDPAKQLDNAEMVKFLNTHYPEIQFSGITVWDKRGDNGYLEIIYAHSKLPISGLNRLPKGYKFDCTHQHIYPTVDGWPRFMVTCKKHPRGILVQMLIKLLHYMDSSI